MRLAQQRVAQVRPDDAGQRAAEQAGESAVRPAHPPLVVHHGDALAEGVEGGFPLLLGAAYHLEEARVGDDDCGVRRERGQEPEVVRDKEALAGVREHQRADDHAVGAQRHGRRRRRDDVAHETHRLPAGIAHQLEVLPADRAGDETGVVGRDRAASQRSQRPFGGDDAQRIARGFARQREQGPLGVEEAHGVPHHLLHDPVELERIGEDV